MTDWLALSDRDAPAGAALAPLAQALFVVEYRLPLDGPTLLLQIQAEDGGALSLFHDPVMGPSVLIRQGGQVRRHRMALALAPDLTGVARVLLRVGPSFWRLRFQAGPSATGSAQGVDGLPMDAALIQRLADRMGTGFRHPAVLWFGLTQQSDLPKSAPWIGLNTPIETDRGAVPAGRLLPGMKIRTLDAGFLPLRALHPMHLPAAGSFAPVVLRRPFFAAERDLLVSADQLLLISGASVEYLTGEEEALVPAGALADGRVADRDNRRAATHCVALDLGRPALVVADGCCLLSRPADGAGLPLPRRALQDWEIVPLLSLLGRTSLRPAA